MTTVVTAPEYENPLTEVMRTLALTYTEKGRRVVVTESANADAERRQWLDGSVLSLQNAYGDSEPEYGPSCDTVTRTPATL